MGNFLKKAGNFGASPSRTILRSANGQSTTNYARNARNTFDGGGVFTPQPADKASFAPVREAVSQIPAFTAPTKTREQMVAETIAAHGVQWANGQPKAAAAPAQPVKRAAPPMLGNRQAMLAALLGRR